MARPLDAGPLPPVPGQERYEPVVAAVGPSIVVWGGNDNRGTTRPVRGGWVIDGATRRWREVRGPLAARRGMQSVGVVSTGRELLVLGARCEVSYRAFRRTHDEDSVRCLGNPRAFVRVDPIAGRASTLPVPRLPLDRHGLNGASGVGWDGSRAYFVLRVRDSLRLVAYDVGRQAWSRVSAPPEFGRRGVTVCISGEEVLGFVRTGQREHIRVWSLGRDGGWRRRTSPPVPPEALLVEPLCGGDVIALNVCGRQPTTHRYRAGERVWRQIPNAPDCLGPIFGRIEDVLYAARDDVLYSLRPTDPVWLEVAVDGPAPGFSEFTAGTYTEIYADRSLVVAPGIVGGSGEFRIRLADATEGAATRAGR